MRGLAVDQTAQTGVEIPAPTRPPVTLAAGIQAKSQRGRRCLERISRILSAPVSHVLYRRGACSAAVLAALRAPILKSIELRHAPGQVERE